MEELVQVRAWDAKAKKHREDEAERNITFLELQQEIRVLEHQMEKRQHLQRKLVGDQDQHQRDFTTRQNQVNTELLSSKSSEKALENQIHKLEEIIAANKMEISFLVSLN